MPEDEKTGFKKLSMGAKKNLQVSNCCRMNVVNLMSIENKPCVILKFTAGVAAKRFDFL